MGTQTGDRTAAAREQAWAQLESVRQMVARLEHLQGGCDGKDCTLTDKEVCEGVNVYYQGNPPDDDMRREYHDEDKAREAILEDALSVEVRSEWHTVGDESDDAEYRITLCTGGPAVQIRGQLGAYSEPDTAILECQDWFTPWVEVETTGEDERIMLVYAQQFYFEAGS